MQNRQAPPFFLVFLLVAAAQVSWADRSAAQPKPENSIDVSVGYGLTAPHHRSKLLGAGPFAMAEYTAPLEEYVGLSAFAALLFTFPQVDDTGQCSVVTCEVTAQVLMAGAKARVAAPIPWVAPFLEAGLGLSFGSVVTRTSLESKEVGPAGVTVNVPLSVGVALGSLRETELVLTYFFHPQVAQYAVTLAITLSVPLLDDYHDHHDHHEEKPWWKFF